jgi:hypothetical protein
VGVGLLLFGPQDREHNVVLTVFWAYWWPVIFLVYPFLGRVWCAGKCPFVRVCIQNVSGYTFPLLSGSYFPLFAGCTFPLLSGCTFRLLSGYTFPLLRVYFSTFVRVCFSTFVRVYFSTIVRAYFSSFSRRRHGCVLTLLVFPHAPGLPIHRPRLVRGSFLSVSLSSLVICSFSIL